VFIDVHIVAAGGVALYHPETTTNSLLTRNTPPKTTSFPKNDGNHKEIEENM
jgi:hypothetical protein